MLTNNSVDSGFVYFPSLDSGALSSYLRTPEKFSSEYMVSPRWWDTIWPEQYRYPYFLISAGVRYKQLEYTSQFNFPPEFTVFGDSGGYQIVSGVLEWSEDLRHRIFMWLENNCNIAANLDLPPRGKLQGKFDFCLQTSKENFKYFSDNQSGKVQYLNCLQGYDYDSYKHWYDAVKGFDFTGWAVGEPQGPARYLASLVLLKDELEKNAVRYIHYFGVSSIQEVVVLAYIQQMFNKLGYNVKIMMDSSSPGLSSTYGFYYSHINLDRDTFKYIHIERDRDGSFYADRNIVPFINEFDTILFSRRSMQTLARTFQGIDYSAIALHNLSVFIDVFKYINSLMLYDDYTIQQLISKDAWGIIEKFKLIWSANNSEVEFKRWIPYFNSIKDNDILKSNQNTEIFF